MGIPGIRHLIASIESVINPTHIRYRWNKGSDSTRALFEGDLTVYLVVTFVFLFVGLFLVPLAFLVVANGLFP